MPIPRSIKQSLNNVGKLAEDTIRQLYIDPIEQTVTETREAIHRLRIQTFVHLRGYSITTMQTIRNIADREFQRIINMRIPDVRKGIVNAILSITNSFFELLFFGQKSLIRRIQEALSGTKLEAELKPLYPRISALIERTDAVFQTVFRNYFENRINDLYVGLLEYSRRFYQRGAEGRSRLFDALIAPLTTLRDRIDTAFTTAYAHLIQEIREITSVYDIEKLAQQTGNVFDFIANILVRILRQVTTIASLVPLWRDCAFACITERKHPEQTPWYQRLKEVRESMEELIQIIQRDQAALNNALIQVYAGFSDTWYGRFASGFSLFMRKIRDFFARFQSAQTRMSKEIDETLRAFREFEETRELISEYSTEKGFRKIRLAFSLYYRQAIAKIRRLFGKDYDTLIQTYLNSLDKDTTEIVRALYQQLQDARSPFQRYRLRQLLYDFIKNGEVQQNLTTHALSLVNNWTGQLLFLSRDTIDRLLREGRLDDVQADTRNLADRIADTFVEMARIYIHGTQVLTTDFGNLTDDLRIRFNEITDIIESIENNQERILNRIRERMNDLNFQGQQMLIQEQLFNQMVDSLRSYRDTIQNLVTSNTNIVHTLARLARYNLGVLLQVNEEQQRTTQEAAQLLRNILTEQTENTFQQYINSLNDTLRQLNIQYQNAIKRGAIQEALMIKRYMEEIKSTINTQIRQYFDVPLDILIQELNRLAREGASEEQLRRLRDIIRLRREVYASEIEKWLDFVATILGNSLGSAIGVARRVLGFVLERTGIANFLRNVRRRVDDVIRTWIDNLRNSQNTVIRTLGSMIGFIYDRITNFSVTGIINFFSRVGTHIDAWLLRLRGSENRFLRAIGSTLDTLYNKLFGSVARPVMNFIRRLWGRVTGNTELLEQANRRREATETIQNIVDRTTNQVDMTTLIQREQQLRGALEGNQNIFQERQIQNARQIEAFIQAINNLGDRVNRVISGQVGLLTIVINRGLDRIVQTINQQTQQIINSMQNYSTQLSNITQDLTQVSNRFREAVDRLANIDFRLLATLANTLSNLNGSIVSAYTDLARIIATGFIGLRSGESPELDDDMQSILSTLRNVNRKYSFAGFIESCCNGRRGNGGPSGGPQQPPGPDLGLLGSLAPFLPFLASNPLLGAGLIGGALAWKFRKPLARGLGWILSKFGRRTPVGAAAEEAAQTAGKSILKAGLKGVGRFIPLLGTGLFLKEAYDSFKQGDIVGGVLNTVGAGVSLIPGVGGLLGTLAIGGVNVLRDLSKNNERQTDDQSIAYLDQSGKAGSVALPKETTNSGYSAILSTLSSVYNELTKQTYILNIIATSSTTTLEYIRAIAYAQQGQYNQAEEVIVNLEQRATSSAISRVGNRAYDVNVLRLNNGGTAPPGNTSIYQNPPTLNIPN